MKICLYCGKEFKPKNPKGKFCSDNCRVYSSRKKSIVINYQPPPIFTSQENIEKFNEAFKKEFDSKLIPPMPTKKEDEHPVDFAARKNEWKRLYGK